MLEREMEDLIATYPDDFFPGRGFELRGRQKSFAGVGRFDLLFEDRFKTNILMELKAVPANYEVATQLAKYKDELLVRGEKHILMCLVAPQVSHSVREFLDRIGIEYTEIHVAEFQRVAERRGLQLRTEIAQVFEEPRSLETTPRRKKPKSSNGTVLPTEMTVEFIRPTIHQLWAKQQGWVKRDQLAEKLAEQTWVTEALNAAGIDDPDERTRRIGNQIDWFSAYYKSGLYDFAGEFDRVRIDGKWAYCPKNSPLSIPSNTKKL